MPISGVAGAGATPFVPPTLDGASRGAGAGGPEGSSFAKSLQSVEKLQTEADSLATSMATGQLQDVHQFTTAAAKASLGIELTAALRNRAVDAYSEIMRMSI